MTDNQDITMKNLTLIRHLAFLAITSLAFVAHADTYIPVTCTWDTGGTTINGTPMHWRICHVGSDTPLIATYTGNVPSNQCQITIMDTNYGYTGSCTTESVFRIIKN